MKKQKHELKKAEEHISSRGVYSGEPNPDYKKPKSPEYWAIRVGLVILGFVIGIIVSNL